MVTPPVSVPVDPPPPSGLKCIRGHACNAARLAPSDGAASGTIRAAAVPGGRPAAAMGKLVIRIATESPSWAQIPHDAGIDPAPPPHWPDLETVLTAQARGIIAANFVQVDTASCPAAST
jgi:hypothetical protein